MKVAFILVALIAFTACKKTPAEVVECVLRDQTLFDDLAELVEIVASGDKSKIFPFILKVYPDIVNMIKTCFQEFSLQAGWDKVIEILIQIFGPIVEEWAKQGLAYLYKMCKEKWGNPMCELIPH